MRNITAESLTRKFLGLSLLKRALFVSLMIAMVAVPLYVTVKAARIGASLWQHWQGQQLNRAAWEAGYTERNESVPDGGPRDGYWGANLGKHKPHPTLSWILSEIELPGRVDIDASGMQYAGPAVPGSLRVLIVGGSTAFGAYASDIEHTYFSRLAGLADSRSMPLRIVVFAAGGWKSSQELKALEIALPSVRPDLVLFLNGLNDITNGSNASALFGEETRTLDGSSWDYLYHEHDYPQRAEHYAANMRWACEHLSSVRIPVVFALQPALFEKTPLSEIEHELLERSVVPLGSAESLRDSYADIRNRLRGIAGNEICHFIDLARIYKREKATIFTDLWHFSDYGHRLLADQLFVELLPILEKLPRENTE